MSSLGMPHEPQEIFKENQASKLGDAPASPSPSTIISSSLVSLYFYHFMRYMLCLERLALRFYFQFSLALLVVHKKLEPRLHCLGEKNDPLHPRTQHRFSCLSLLSVLYFFQLLSFLALIFHAYLFKSFYLGCCFQNSLDFSSLSCLESWPVALSCVS